MYIIIIFIILILIITFLSLRNIEHLDNIGYDFNVVAKDNLFTSSPKLPVSPSFKSNYHMSNYDDGIFVEPARYDDLNEDVKENRSGSVQPYSSYFDILDINCSETFRRPWSCLIVKGNFVNEIPRKFCNKVCPERFHKPEIKESFRNFTDKPFPSHYWCYNGCKKTCEKKPYNPIDPSKNTCGENGYSQVPLPVALSKKECMDYALPCDKLNKKQCLARSECGYCVNGAGRGTCFSSTTEGPLNINIPCTPDRVNATSGFWKGHANPFEGVQQSWNIPSFSPLTI